MPLNCDVEKTPESPLDSKEIKQVNLKGDQPWIVTARTDTATKALVFWSSDVNRWLIRKVPDSGKGWRQKEKMASEDEIGWCNEHELGKLQEMVRGTGRPVCCYTWCGVVGHDWWLNNNNSSIFYLNQSIYEEIISTYAGTTYFIVLCRYCVFF